MLPGVVVLVLVLTSPPLASSHAVGQGVGPPKGRPWGPRTGLPLWRPRRNLCDTLGCTEFEVCVVTHDDSAYCLESDCWTHPCPKDSQCIVVDGLPTCYSFDCEFGSSVYKHGEGDGCYYTCYNGKMKTFKPTTGNQCKEPFEMNGGNCYYYNVTMLPWCEARKICQHHGGDLAVDNFNTLKAFYNLKEEGTFTWLGIWNDRWLNGQEPQQEQWDINEEDPEPYAENVCGYMRSGGLAELPCDIPWPFVCQLY